MIIFSDHSSSDSHMNLVKRRSDEDVSSDKEIKKLQKAITSIEQLSNEIFHEIFDYIDACNIFNAFSSLNIRFNRLVNYSSSPIKISCFIPLDYNDCYRQVVLPNRHRIISFHLHDKLCISSFFSMHTIDRSFNRLESLVLNGIQSDKLILLLPNLNALPYLFSLKIRLEKQFRNFPTLYFLIFRLPVLKYYKISAIRDIFSPSIQYTINGFSSIEHLVMDYDCHLPNLIKVLSNTPQLRYLTCNTLDTFDLPSIQIPTDICNLRYVCINWCALKFDVFKMLIKNWFSQIRVLRLTTWLGSYLDGNRYIDADRWEQLILHHMPHLRIFELKNSAEMYDPSDYTPCHLVLGRFNSPFWIQRKWFFHLKVHIHLFRRITLLYSIQPIKYANKNSIYK